MARQYRLDPSPRAAVTAALVGLPLLWLPLACGSDSEGVDEPAGSDRADAPEMNAARPRDAERSPASDAEPIPAADGSDTDESPALNGSAPAPANGAGESPPTPAAAEVGSDILPPAAASAFASCTRSEGTYGTNCDYVHVTMTQTSPPRCVQLTIDNCASGGYGRPALSVRVPFSWQLSSASIGTDPDECELGVFDPESTIVIAASGSIEFETPAPNALPAGITLDVALEPSRSAEDTTEVDVVTSEPLNPTRCED